LTLKHGALTIRAERQASGVKRQLLEIRHVLPAVVEPLIQAEVEEWSSRLRWQRPELLQQLRTLLHRRRLAGWILQVDGKAAGKVLVGDQGGTGSLEMAYVLPSHRTTDHLAWMLGAAAEQLLKQDPVPRLEAGLFPFQRADIGSWLRRVGFHEMWRDYMEKNLSAGGDSSDSTLEDWPPDVEEVAQLLQLSYKDGVDARGSNFYQTLAGCRAYLQALLSGSECGGVSLPLSGVYRDLRGHLAGLVLGTRLASEVAHLAQIAVRPDCRGSGLGELLLGHFISSARQAGMKRVTLIASRENDLAYPWYRRQGFQPVEPYVCYWRDGRPPR
jgi:ribosomal protein S18 acetylase RimI-like enzyme